MNIDKEYLHILDKIISILWVLQYDYGVIVYRSKDENIKIGIDSKYESEKPLENPEVKKLLDELYSWKNRLH